MGKLKELILIGGGGHCKACIDVIEQENKFSIVGIIDLKGKIGQNILGYPIIGCDDDLSELSLKYDHFLITLGQIESAELRINLYDTLKKLGKTIATIISPKAYVSSSAKIDEGTIVMHGAIINSSTIIGKNCIINSMALIEHDNKIGNHCHISTAAVLNGGCRLKNQIFIGSNSVLVQQISIEENTIIGAGSVVTKSLTSGTYAGNPTKSI